MNSQDTQTLASDESLCEAVRAGESSAFATLYERHVGEALGYARKLNSNIAEDVVAEVMTTLLTMLSAGKGPTDSFRSYLLLSIRNAVYRAGKAPFVDELPDDEALPVSESVPALDVSDEHRVVQEAMRQLPERWRAALVLSDVEQRSLSDIGAELGIEANAVSALLRRARLGLRRSWVAAHFAGAQVSRHCDPIVESLNTLRWGSPSAHERSELEAHLHHCDHCSDQRAEHAWLAQAVGLVVAPLLTLGGVFSDRIRKLWQSGSRSTSAATVGLAAQAVVVLSLGLVAGLMPLLDAQIAPEASTSVELLEAQQLAETTPGSTSESTAGASNATDDGSASTLSATENEERLTSDVAAAPETQAETPPPVTAPEDSAGNSSPPASEATWLETVSGGTSPGTTLNFLLSDGTNIVTVSDSSGAFSFQTEWSASKPAFSFVVI